MMRRAIQLAPLILVCSFVFARTGVATADDPPLLLLGDSIQTADYAALVHLQDVEDPTTFQSSICAVLSLMGADALGAIVKDNLDPSGDLDSWQRAMRIDQMECDSPSP